MVVVLRGMVLLLALAAALVAGCTAPAGTADPVTTEAVGPSGQAAAAAGASGGASDGQSAAPFGSTQPPGSGSPGAGAGSTVAPGVTRIQEDNAYLAYTGIWTQSVSPEEADGDFQFASQKSSVTIRFDGTSVAYIAKKAYVYGKASVTLDDRTPVPVDLDYPVAQYQQRVWESGPLQAGPHTVRVEYTGDPGTDQRGAFINLDAFEIEGELLFAADPARVEQDDERFYYLGDWRTSADSSASGSGFRFTDSPGASVTFAFNGLYFAWIAKTGPQYGKAKVTMYGSHKGVVPEPVVVDLYSPTEAWEKVVLDAPFDSAGPTSVSIEWTGEKSAGATGTTIDIDAADIVGSLVQAPARYEETRGRHYAFADTFAWNVYSPAQYASGRKYATTEFVGATATIQFDGRYLAWVAKTAPVYGIALVSLDGGEPVEVDLYTKEFMWKQHVWNTGLLEPGLHTVRIEVSGRKSPGATKAFVNIDGFDILGRLVSGY